MKNLGFRRPQGEILRFAQNDRLWYSHPARFLIAYPCCAPGVRRIGRGQRTRSDFNRMRFGGCHCPYGQCLPNNARADKPPVAPNLLRP
jgi:hypothetical protein